MSAASTSAPARWARAWIFDWALLVTSGVPGAVGQDRVAELASDLWEQSVAADRRGIGGSRLAVELLARAARGVGGDLGWRHAARRARRTAPLVPLIASPIDGFDQTSGALKTLASELPDEKDAATHALTAGVAIFGFSGGPRLN